MWSSSRVPTIILKLPVEARGTGMVSLLLTVSSCTEVNRGALRTVVCLGLRNG